MTLFPRNSFGMSDENSYFFSQNKNDYPENAETGKCPLSW